jgi:hypothetical protein
MVEEEGEGGVPRTARLFVADAEEPRASTASDGARGRSASLTVGHRGPHPAAPVAATTCEREGERERLRVVPPSPRART